MTLLDKSSVEAIDEINDAYKLAYFAINKKKPKMEIWDIWGQFYIDSKIELENAIRLTDYDIIKWLYALLQQRNQLISINFKTRLGSVGLKRSLNKTSILVAQLITGSRKPAIPDKICTTVDEHILKLSTGQYDTVLETKIYVKDYPKDKQYPAPAHIITTKETLVEDNDV